MRNELAERLLSRVMGWNTSQVQVHIPDLQALSMVKYDEYGNYGPGAKFVENLAAWLDQFPDDKQQVALDFVMDELVFISENQMSHLISLVATEIIAPVLRKRVATAHGIPLYRIAELERHPEFARLRRASLIVGASDGARLDRLRRSSSGLSHEQFLQGVTPNVEQLEPMASKLAEAIKAPEGDGAPFEHVFLVDDFSGSGRTLIRQEKDGSLDGKLIRLRDHLASAAEAGHIISDVPGTVVLYCASEQAMGQVGEGLKQGGFSGWEVQSIDLLPSSKRVDITNSQMTQLCRDFVDPITEDPHKGLAPIGYADCALPLVLSHNTPNNSICLLWMDTRGREGSKELHALFPRYERHHPDRP